MSIAQELYEGIELGEYGLTGLITYMRTDSLRLADEATAAAAGFIRGRYGEEYYPGKPRVFKTKGNAQDAHEAIRPSNVQLLPEEIRKYLTPDQFKLYRLIWSRFVACQMADAILDTVSADIVCEDQVFRASGHTVAFPGFTAVYEEGTDDEKKQDSAGKPLPRFDQGDKLTAEKIEPSQHFTQPPARYTEASLIRAMEERGIGRPSTYAPTISTIIDRDYVTKENKALRPTPLGEGVTGLLVDEFKSVADYEFTANMEHELDEVEAGKLNYIQLLHNFYDGFEAALKQAEIDLEGKRIKIQDEVTDVICEKCGRNMVIKSGRFGKFLACPGFPECTNTKPITEDTGAACPVCGAKVVKKKSARGYVYYSCDTYPTCQFMTWDKPLKTKCPNCDSSLFRHTDRDSKEVTDVCLREGCGYKELVKEGLPPEEAEKRRKMREARAAKAAERAAAKEAAEKNGETEEKVKKATKKASTKKSTAKKTLPWMTKTTNKFKKLKDEAVQELTAKQQEQYAKALAKYEAEKAAEKAKKAAEKKAAAKKACRKEKDHGKGERRMSEMVTVVGAGLAGCEAAWQLAQRGISVRLCEMKPVQHTPAHHSDDFAELVCSNSLRSDELANAAGLLKEELRRLDSLILSCADAHRVEAGGALAVDREAFAAAVTEKIKNHPNIEVVYGEVTEIPEGRVVIASGPLTSGYAV